MSTVSKGTTTVWVTIVAGTLLLVASTGLVSGQRPAGAQSEDSLVGPTLQFGCGVAKVSAMDPIFDPEHPHEHVFYGNKGVNADSTYDSLVNNPDTTCSRAFATSSYWHPVVKDGTEVNSPKRLSVYYVGAGDQTQIQHIPDGLQLLGKDENGEVDYRCGQDPPMSSPPYGCTADEFRIRVHFPECWDRSSLAPDSLVDKSSRGCPSSHPYQIPTIRLSVHYENEGGVLEGPLMVSAGGGEFLGADFFHADVFDAPQQPDFNDAIKKCVMDVGDDELPPSVCRPGLTPETTLDPSGPSGTVGSGSAEFTFSSTETDATFRCRVYQAGTTPGTFGACSGNGTHSVSGLESGTYTFEVRAVDAVGKEDPTPASRTWTINSTPTVIDTTTSLEPDKGAPGVARNTNISATFSEEMAVISLKNPDNTSSTFKLQQYNKKTRKWKTIPATITLSNGNTTATLDPFGATETLLAANKKFRGLITTGAKDAAGNPLASNFIWTFTTGSS